MLHLREKAHYSLDEFRKGRGSPLGKYSMSEPPTPVDDDDELSLLGGKTRLVAKREPTSPIIMDRSPTFGQPIVPLPPMGQVHPNIWEYLNTFVPPQNQDAPNQNRSPAGTQSRHNSSPSSPRGPSAQNSYSEELSPVSMYGLSTMPTSPTFHTEPTPYAHQQQLHQSSPTNQFSQHNQLPHAQQQQQGMMGNMQASSSTMAPATNPAFPQYFPVYDYGASLVNSGMSGGLNGGRFGSAPMLDANPIPSGQRRASGSPEGNMQSTWQEFVDGLAM